MTQFWSAAIISLSRNRAEEGTGNILWAMQFTSNYTYICLDISHVTLKIYLLCPCLYCTLSSVKFVDNKASKHLFFLDGVLIGSITISILLRQASYKTSRVRSYMQVRHTRSRGNVINYKRLRSISIYR